MRYLRFGNTFYAEDWSVCIKFKNNLGKDGDQWRAEIYKPVDQTFDSSQTAETGYHLLTAIHGDEAKAYNRYLDTRSDSPLFELGEK